MKSVFIFSKITIKIINLLQKPKNGGIPAIDKKVFNVGDVIFFKSLINLSSFIVLKYVVSNINMIKKI
jgi:hypothetical protein